MGMTARFDSATTVVLANQGAQRSFAGARMGPCVRRNDECYPLAAPTLENRRRMRIISPSQTSR